MSPVALTFLASTIVAILFVPFALYQGPKASRAILSLRAPGTGKKSIRDDPRNVEAYVDQALDIAYGFPALILTVVAYADLGRDVIWASACIPLAAVAITLFLVWFSSPKRVDLYLKTRIRLRKGFVSTLSIFILVANIVGLIMAMAS